MHCWPTQPRVARWIVGGLAAAVVCFTTASAAAACDEPAGQLLSAEGVVERRSATDAPWLPIKPPATLCAGDMVAVRPPGRAAVQLQDGSLLRLDENSTLHVLAVRREGQTELGLIEGLLHVITRMRKNFSVTTPFVNALVEGTEFNIASDERGAQVVVESGSVRTQNRHGSVLLPAGAAIAASAGKGPSRIEVRPLDALRWAIHYPQIIWHSDDMLAAMAEPQADSLRQAQASMSASRFAEALGRLDADQQRSPAFASTRISLLLALGRVDDALALLAQIPAASNPEASALRAVIQVARNQPQAIETARAANASNENSAAARLALSYALQARGELDKALVAAVDATRLAPANPFAWARRAEIELSLAQSSAARRSLAELNRRAPRLPRAKALLGFVQLIEGETEAALETFTRALAADDSDSLAYFGRGLAAIRVGNYEQGRSDAERAVLHDPGNAELRAYLARVYVGEDRSALAGKELRLARRLDPASPTPWQFDALRKLRENDPIGALADGQMAIDLNDNRAVMRSTRLLNVDRATRSANLGPAYTELGFKQSLRIAANDAIASDPIGPAGHRLLAQAYAENPRFETARISQSLQTRISQPLGQSPMAPQLMISQLPIVGGPNALTQVEGSDLFERGPAHYSMTALAGTQSTHALTALASRSSDRSEIEFGHFQYARTAPDQFTDMDLRATRVGLRLVPSATTALHAEAWSEDRAGGAEFEPLLLGLGTQPKFLRDHSVHRNATRISLRHAADATEELLVTAATQRVEEQTDNRLLNLPIGAIDRVGLSSTALGSRYWKHTRDLDWVLGISRYRARWRSEGDTETPAFLIPGIPTWDSFEHNRLYAYASLPLSHGIRGNLGYAFEVLNGNESESAKMPRYKIGLSARIGARTSIRLAATQGLKGQKYDDQSLEPTQFTGFNQLFDDLTGTRWTRKSIAMEHRFQRGGTVGATLSRRRLKIPNFGCNSDPMPCLGRWREELHRVYFEKPISRRTAVSISWIWERLTLDGDASTTQYPNHIRTEMTPIGLWHRIDSRLNAKVEAIQIRQNASISASDGEIEKRSTSRWITNAKLSYARPTPAHSIEFSANNIFDQKLRMENSDFSGNPKVPLFYRERTVLIEASFRF